MRNSITERPKYRGGRTPLDVMRESGRIAIKLSSNEVPYGPHESVSAAVAAAALELNRYPEPLNVALLDAVASAHGLSPDQICVSNGTATIIDALFRLTTAPGNVVVHAWRTFEAIVPLMSLAGIGSVPIPLKNQQHDFDAMLAALTPQTAFVYVCNPNNPSGTVAPAADLRRFLDAVPAETMVVLDEAYIHFSTDAGTLDGLRELANYPNLVVLRTFSKAYGLAALRSGFAAASPAITVELSKVIAPFSVTNLAAAATIASLGDDALAAMGPRVAQIVEERGRLGRAFEQLGIEIVSGSAANFIFLPMDSGAQELARALEFFGIIVRPYADGVRVTVGSPEQNSELIAAATTLVARGEFAELVA